MSSPNHITTKHPQPQRRPLQQKLPDYKRTQTQAPRLPLSSREPQVSPTPTQILQAPKYRLTAKGAPDFVIAPQPANLLRRPPKPRHAPKVPSPVSPAPPAAGEGGSIHACAREKRVRPLTPSLQTSRGQAPDEFSSARLLTDPRVTPPANERLPFGAVPI